MKRLRALRPTTAKALKLQCTGNAYSLKSVVFSHGWSDLAPFYVQSDSGNMKVVLRTHKGPISVWVFSVKNGVEVRARTPLSCGDVEALRWMLRLDEDLSKFYSLSQKKRKPWIATQQMGRLLRSQDLFEDLIKLILTTNCSWSLTRLMTDRLSRLLGAEAQDHFFAFPTAEALAGKTELFYRNEVRAGYRSKVLPILAEKFLNGEFDPKRWLEPERPSDEVRKEIIQLPGAGPYVAENLMRLMGRTDRLGLDSWARGKLKENWKMKRLPSDRTIERKYKEFGEFRGLVLWCDLTKNWLTENDFSNWIRKRN